MTQRADAAACRSTPSRAAAACGCTYASGATRPGRRSCSSTAGRRTTSAGPGSTRARWPTSSGSSPSTCAATACPRRRSSAEHYTDGALWADDVAAIIDAAARSTAPCSSAGPTAPSSSATTCARTAQDRDRRDRLRRRRRQARRGGVRHADRPRLPRPLRRRDGRRSADQHPGHARLRAGVPGDTAAGRRLRDRAVLEHRRAARDPRRTSPRARSTTTTCCARSMCRVLVTHGRADTVVLPAMAEHILATCPTAEASWYDGVGHAPHLEEPERFNRELAALTTRLPA